MRPKSFLSKILLNRWFIAVLLSVVIFVLLPVDSTPYVIDTLPGAHRQNSDRLIFCDLMGDEEEETVVTIYEEEEDRVSFLVLNADGSTYEQYNAYGYQPLYKDGAQVSALKGKKKHLLSLPALKGNQLVLLNLDISQKDPEIEAADILVIPEDTILHNGMMVTDIQSRDLDKDGCEEIYFVLYGQYKLAYFRKLVCYNPASFQAKHSDRMGNIIHDIQFVDMDHDGYLEITGSMGSPNNIKKENVLYPDWRPYFMVFRNDLKPYMDPIPFDGPMRHLGVHFFGNPSREHMVLILHNKKSRSDFDYFFRLDSNYQVIKIDSIAQEEKVLLHQLKPFKVDQDSLLITANHEGEFVLFNDQLQVFKRFVIDSKQTFKEHYIDLNGDGTDEITLVDAMDDLLVLNYQGKLLAKAHLPGLDASSTVNWFQARQNGTLNTILFHGGKVSQLNLSANYFHYLKWLILAGLIVFFRIFSAFNLWVQSKQMRKQSELEDEIKQLQLQSIKSQLDPHFIVNSMNVLNYLSQNKDTKGVESFTHHFSRLFRKHLSTSDQPYVSLYDELQFVSHYVELQRLRFDIPIALDIDTSPNTDMNLRIPKMLIHTHVDNAIKHGLIPVKGGKITISIIDQKYGTRISIEDNGVGLQGEKTKEVSSGKGLLILEELIILFKQLYKIDIKQKIEEREGGGVRVLLLVR